MHILVTLLAPLLHLKSGTQLRVELPADMPRFDAQTLADNLAMGSLCHVATAKAGPKQQAQLVANFDGSTCFGREVAKAGDIGIAFNCPGSPDERVAFAEALRLGVHADKLSVTLADDLPPAPAAPTAPPAPPAIIPPPAGAPATQGQVPPPGK